jgi:hypothetical protein
LSAARALVLSWLVRAAILFFASLVGWGALLLASAVLQVGPGGLARLFLPRGQPFWAWLNAGAAALAVAVGLFAVGAAVRGRAGRPPTT